MPKARLLKAYLLGVADDTEIVLTDTPEHTDHIDGDFMSMDYVLSELERIEDGTSVE